jgi:hypothetical protein
MKKNATTNTMYALFAVLFLFASCKKEEENLEVGFSQEIENFVPDSTIEKMRDLGMVINEGKQPPSIEGTYLVSPMIMKSSNVPNESYEIGHQFINYKYHFYNQNNDELTIEMDATGINDYNRIISESKGQGAFIAGYNDSFTAFLIEEGYSVKNTFDTSYFSMLTVSSGQISASGIKDYHQAIWMLDDFGDPHGNLIPVNSGRVFFDSDSLADYIFMEKKGNINNKKEVVNYLPATVMN